MFPETEARRFNCSSKNWPKVRVWASLLLLILSERGIVDESEAEWEISSVLYQLKREYRPREPKRLRAVVLYEAFIDSVSVLLSYERESFLEASASRFVGRIRFLSRDPGVREKRAEIEGV